MEKENRDLFANRKEIWSSWSEDYYRSLYKDIKEYPSLVMRHRYILELFDQGGKRVLDIGCGPGEMLQDLSEQGCEVCGVDISAGMLEVAKKNLQSAKTGSPVFLGCGNIESLGFKDGTFDAVICAGVIEYLDDDGPALGELNRVLRDDGTMIITVRNKTCVPRVLDPFINWMRRIAFGQKVMRTIRGSLADEGGGEKPYVRYHKHFPWELDEKLMKHGFRKEDFRYFHFYPFFVPFDKVLPAAFVRIGLKMERFSHSMLGGFLGSGYIVKSRKVKDGPAAAIG